MENHKSLHPLFASILMLFLMSCCGFDEGCVGRSNSKALREAEKYWEIKNETIVPLVEVPIESGVMVTYSTDGIKYKTVKIHHYKKGLEFHKLNYPEREAEIQKRYNKVLEKHL